MRQKKLMIGMTQSQFQSTHRVSDATGFCCFIRGHAKISIHAPRERCDRCSFILRNTGRGISIHAPRERCDGEPVGYWSENGISIHAPRERCDLDVLSSCAIKQISIHAPRERCDIKRAPEFTSGFKFQSTHRVSDATICTYAS